jgi:hypothetical protein
LVYGGQHPVVFFRDADHFFDFVAKGIRDPKTLDLSLFIEGVDCVKLKLKGDATIRGVEVVDVELTFQVVNSTNLSRETPVGLTCSAFIFFKLASALEMIASFVDGTGMAAPDHFESISNVFAMPISAMTSSCAPWMAAESMFLTLAALRMEAASFIPSYPPKLFSVRKEFAPMTSPTVGDILICCARLAEGSLELAETERF